MYSPNQMLPIKTKQSAIKFSRLFAELNSGRIIFSSHSWMFLPEILLFSSETARVQAGKATRNWVFYLRRLNANVCKKSAKQKCNLGLPFETDSSDEEPWHLLSNLTGKVMRLLYSANYNIDYDCFCQLVNLNGVFF